MMNGKVILAIFAGAGVAAYLLRDKIAEGLLALQEKVQTLVEDHTPDEPEPDHETFPENVHGYKVGQDPR
jgi:hypothetical protein